MTRRFPPQQCSGRPLAIDRRTDPDRPAVPNVRQLWLADLGSIDRARDVIQATDVGRQLLADDPCFDEDDLATSNGWVIALLAICIPMMLAFAALVILTAIRLSS